MKRKADYVFLVSLAAFVLLSAASGAGLLHPLDLRVLHAAQSRPSEVLDTAGAVFSVPGGLEYSGVAMLALSAGLLLTGRRPLAWRVLAAFVATGLLELAMKMWLPQVPVPDEAPRSTDPSVIMEVDYAHPYPSGHMLRAVILFGAVFLLWQNSLLRTAMLLVLLAVAAARIYLGVHWVSDVMGGALLGVVGLAWAFRASQHFSPPPFQGGLSVRSG